MNINFKTSELTNVRWPEDKGNIEKLFVMKGKKGGKSQSYWAKVPIDLLYNMLLSVDLLQRVKERQDKLEKKDSETKTN